MRAEKAGPAGDEDAFICHIKLRKGLKERGPR
jgi:hypothetical protein